MNKTSKIPGNYQAFLDSNPARKCGDTERQMDIRTGPELRSCMIADSVRLTFNTLTSGIPNQCIGKRHSIISTTRRSSQNRRSDKYSSPLHLPREKGVFKISSSGERRWIRRQMPRGLLWTGVKIGPKSEKWQILRPKGLLCSPISNGAVGRMSLFWST